MVSIVSLVVAVVNALKVKRFLRKYYDIIVSRKAVWLEMSMKKSWITSAHRGFVDGTLKENSLAA